jgi:WD40 repeat protein
MATGGTDGTVRLWEIESARQVAALQGQEGGVWSVALSADGHLLVAGGTDGTVRLWESEKTHSKWRLVAILKGHAAGVWSVALDGDGQLAASGSFDGTVKLWDVKSRACLRTLSAERCYEQLDITGLTGVTSAQRASLLALGAVDHLG